ncbi:MAG TPA: response regulator [Gemmatimonadales bacterium]|nr:response regulator [Gemmatimonadales bacterium]HSE67396.1 response regulator [Gemmatimonadales bacterium]
MDDEEGLRRIAKRALELAGYRVTTAADGVQGLEAFQAHKQEIVLVVSDITMPNLDGVGLQRAIHQHGDQVPFLFISGLPPEDVLQASSGMVTDVLAKPWTVAELTERVRQILSRP